MEKSSPSSGRKRARNALVPSRRFTSGAENAWKKELRWSISTQARRKPIWRSRRLGSHRREPKFRCSIRAAARPISRRSQATRNARNWILPRRGKTTKLYRACNQGAAATGVEVAQAKDRVDRAQEQIHALEQRRASLVAKPTAPRRKLAYAMPKPPSRLPRSASRRAWSAPPFREPSINSISNRERIWRPATWWRPSEIYRACG